MLCGELRLARLGRREPDHRARQQLLQDQLQFRTDAALLARSQSAQRLRSDLGSRPGKSKEFFRSRLRLSPGLQSYDSAAGQRARPIFANLVGHSRLRAPLQAGAGGHVAAGNRSRSSVSGNSRRAGDSLHDSRAASGRPHTAARRARLARRQRRSYRPDAGLRATVAVRAKDCAIFLRRPDLSCRRFRRVALPRRRFRQPAARRLY